MSEPDRERPPSSGHKRSRTSISPMPPIRRRSSTSSGGEQRLPAASTTASSGGAGGDVTLEGSAGEGSTSARTPVPLPARRRSRTPGGSLHTFLSPRERERSLHRSSVSIGGGPTSSFQPPESPSGASHNRPLINLAPPSLGRRSRSPLPQQQQQQQQQQQTAAESGYSLGGRRRSASPDPASEREQRRRSGAGRESLSSRYGRAALETQLQSMGGSGPPLPPPPPPPQSQQQQQLGQPGSSSLRYYQTSPTLPTGSESWSSTRPGTSARSPALRPMTSSSSHRYAASVGSPLIQQQTVPASSGPYGTPTGGNQQPLPYESATGWTSTAPPYVPPPSVFATQPVAGPSSSSAIATGPPAAYGSMYYSGRSDPSVFSQDLDDSESGSLSGRDLGRERPPRSMMACVRCRKQKMKCDGPAAAPCRGCRSANITCVFETRTRTSRPKSISSIGAAQPLPAITTTSIGGLGGPTFSQQPRPTMDPYQLAGVSSTSGIQDRVYRQGPPAGSVISRGFANERPPGSAGQPSVMGAPSLIPPQAQMVSGAITARSTAPIGRPSVMIPQDVQATQIHRETPLPGTPDNAIEARLRSLETMARVVETVQASNQALQASVALLESQVRTLSSQVSTLSQRETKPSMSSIPEESRKSSSGSSRSAEQAVSDDLVEVYRSFVTTLAPWLPQLNSVEGLSGEVIRHLGIKVRSLHGQVSETPEQSRNRIRRNIGKLMSGTQPLIDEDLLALGVFAAWEGDESLASSAVAQARVRGSQAVVESGRMEGARAWAGLVVIEHMLCTTRIPNYIPSLSHGPITRVWRDRIQTFQNVTPSERDRNFKMLAWLEFAELLAEAQTTLIAPMSRIGTQRQASAGVEGSRAGVSPSSAGVERAEARARQQSLNARLDNWKQQWAGAGDPILNLHYHYAVLCISSPLIFSDPAAWVETSQDSAGYALIEKARDAAHELISKMCASDFVGTLPYSLPLLRWLLAFACCHLIGQGAALPQSQLTSLPRIQQSLRQVYDALGAGGEPSTRRAGRTLLEIIETGDVDRIGRRDILGFPPGKDLWAKVLAPA